MHLLLTFFLSEEAKMMYQEKQLNGKSLRRNVCVPGYGFGDSAGDCHLCDS